MSNKFIFNILDDYINKKNNVSLKNVIQFINSGTYNLAETNNDNLTALMFACSKGLSEIALALIQTGQSVPEHINNYGNTALIFACSKGMPEVALAIIETGKSRPEQVNKNGDTALILACFKSMSEVALELIQTGKSIPEHINNNGDTALIVACSKSMSEVALALIQTGKSIPEHINKLNDTALIIACHYKMPEVALALIETGKSRPEHIDDDDNTALLLACYFQLPEVALALIQTGKSIPEQINKRGDTALDYAKKNGLTEIVKLLLEIEDERTININATGFDQSTQEHSKISDFLSRSSNNICIKSNKTYFLTSKQFIKKNLEKTDNIKYGCIEAGETGPDGINRFTEDSNIIYNKKYLTLSSLIGLQILVDYDEMQKIANNKNYSKLFYVTPSGKRLASIISQAYINGGPGMSADHCGLGKQRDVYNIYAATPMCGESSESETQLSAAAVEPQNEIKVQYKGYIFSFPIEETFTLEDIKNLLLEKIMTDTSIASKDQIDSKDQNVKFIYKGRIYKDNLNSVTLSSLENPPFGITLQLMVSKITGGRKTRKIRRRKTRKIRRRKTRKIRRRARNI